MMSEEEGRRQRESPGLDDRPRGHGHEDGRWRFRPAYNVQFGTDTASQIIVGIDAAICGSDQGQMAPMVEQIHERYEQYPKDVLVDGGFVKHDDIDTVSAPEQGCTVYGPVPKPKDASQDRYAPRATNSSAVAAWRQRRASAEAQRSTRTARRRRSA